MYCVVSGHAVNILYYVICSQAVNILYYVIYSLAVNVLYYDICSQAANVLYYVICSQAINVLYCVVCYVIIHRAACIACCVISCRAACVICYVISRRAACVVCCDISRRAACVVCYVIGCRDACVVYYVIARHTVCSVQPNGLSILQQNIDGLFGQPKHLANGWPADTNVKIDYLRFASKFKFSPAIICITESKLGNKIDDAEVAIPGYTIFRRDRNHRGGGIAIYTKSTLRASIIETAASIEHCALRITLADGNPFILLCIYKPPSTKLSDWEEPLHSLLEFIISNKEPVVIVGDFNIDLLKDCSFSNEMKSNFHLTQFITEPTRIMKSSATLIDHVYASRRSMMLESGVINFHLSDHHATFCTLIQNSGRSSDVDRPQGSQQFIEYCAFAKINEFKFNNDLQTAPWSVMNAFDDINDILGCFSNFFLDIWNKHALVKNVRKQYISSHG